jgi:antirestriction protein ArdC
VVDAVRFGDTNYSKEELVAEMGAAFLCGVAGIDNRTTDTSASYIRGWLKKLRNDPRMLVQAAGQAQRAADYILGKEGGDGE